MEKIEFAIKATAVLALVIPVLYAIPFWALVIMFGGPAVLVLASLGISKRNR